MQTLLRYICEPISTLDATRSLKRRIRFLNFTMFVAGCLAIPSAIGAYFYWFYSGLNEDLVSAVLLTINAISFPICWKLGKIGKSEFSGVFYAVIMQVTVAIWLYFHANILASGVAVVLYLLPMVICSSALSFRVAKVVLGITVLSTVVAIALSSLDGDVKVYVVCVVTVISSALSFLTHLRERDDEELANETKNFLRASQLHAIAENTASIGHEIRNVLGVITGTTRLTKSRLRINGVLTPDELAAHLQYVEDATGRMLKIIEGMRKMSRNEGELAQMNVSLASVVNESISMNQQRAHQKGVQVQLELALTQDSASLFEVQTIQALTNLIGNAIDAASLSEKKWVKVTCECNSESLVFKVLDSGPGIDEELRRKIFETFFTTKESGNGIGLSVIRRVADLHRGRLELMPYVAGKGAEFHLIYPLKDELPPISQS